MDKDAIISKKFTDTNLPKKYIRTFEGDTKTVKEGRVPDLVPLTSRDDSATEDDYITMTVPDVTPPPPPVSVPIPLTTKPKPTPPPLPDPVVTITETPVVAPPTFSRVPPPPPPPVPVPPPPPPLPPPPVEEPLPAVAPVPSPSSLETYSDDFAQRMKDTHSTVATVLAAEQDSMTGAPQMDPKKSSRSGVFYIVGGVTLLIAAGIGAYIANTQYLAKIQSVIFAPSISSVIFVDEREQLSGTGLSLAQAITLSSARAIASGAVRLVYIEASTSTPESVFTALRLPAPNILLRNTNTVGSMAGIVNAGGNQSPFFILSVATYSETFSGMLLWEPKMTQDFKQIFFSYPPPVPTAPIATSTKKVTAKPTIIPNISNEPLKFIDEVIANHDVRVYRDASGRSVMLYGYWNQKTLVIARDPASFSEILQRLANSRAQ